VTSEQPQCSPEKLESLLIDSDFELLELELAKQNIFDILRISRAEIRHSNFLAWLLDPNESHNLGRYFLRRFLMDIFRDKRNPNVDLADVDRLDYQNVEIRREWENIDLAVIFPNTAIIIENKVDASDSEDQLQKYKARAESSFADKDHLHFVYLTPDGDLPRDIKSQDLYVPYSYGQLIASLETIVSVYCDTMNSKTRTYIEDYIASVRRSILGKDKASELALKIYLDHKDALDFIFRQRPDPASILYDPFTRAVGEMGWVVGSKNKGYVRFTTPALKTLLPLGQGVGWPDKEIFLFEIDYLWNGKQAVFKSVVSPGNEQLREIINKALCDAPGAKKPSGKKWLVHYSKATEFSAVEAADQDEGERYTAIMSILKSVVGIVADAEGAILAEKCAIMAALDDTV
jgi:hypothetical protein